MNKRCILCDKQSTHLKLYNEMYFCEDCFESNIKEMEKISSNRKPNESPPIHIIDNLYIGDEDTSKVEELLVKSNISNIIIAAKNLKKNFEGKFEYLYLDIDDSLEENISRYFEASLSFIQNSPKNVLVHCVSGISRSGTIVLLYLIKNKK